MMHQKTITIPAIAEYTLKVDDFKTCDLCGRKIQHGDDDHNLAEVIMEYRLGDTFPECGRVSTQRFDVCPTCWTTKIVPWMKEQYAQPTTTTEEW